MNIMRTAAMLAAGAITMVGCGSSDNLNMSAEERAAALEAKVAALESQNATSTTIDATTTTTSAPATTTTAAPTTTTTARATTATASKPVVPKPVVKAAVPVTTSTLAPWCQASALVAQTTKGMSQTVLITSNLPSRVATVRLSSNQSVTTDPGGNATYSFTSPGGQITATMGRILTKTNTVKVTFYSLPTTPAMPFDEPYPPVVASCEAKFVSVGP